MPLAQNFNRKSVNSKVAIFVAHKISATIVAEGDVGAPLYPHKPTKLSVEELEKSRSYL